MVSLQRQEHLSPWTGHVLKAKFPRDSELEDCCFRSAMLGGILLELVCERDSDVCPYYFRLTLPAASEGANAALRRVHRKLSSKCLLEHFPLRDAVLGGISVNSVSNIDRHTKNVLP